MQEAKAKVVTRLSAGEYKQLEKKLGHIQVGPTTTQLEVAYQLGAQAVLKILREGFVYGDIATS